jgi:hypothetical protein
MKHMYTIRQIHIATLKEIFRRHEMFACSFRYDGCRLKLSLSSTQSLDVAQCMEVSVLSTIHPYHAVPKPLLLFDHDGSIEWVSPHHQSRKTLINSEHIAMRAVQHQQS